VTAPAQHFQTIIIGAGAAGMQAAAFAGTRGGSVLVLDHAKAPGEKIRISGGGRCNFTNMGAEPKHFLSQNPHFAKSALKRYTQWDFIDLVARHGVAYHEKTLGQLFCDNSAKDIITLLLDEMEKVGAKLWLRTSVQTLSPRPEGGFALSVEREGTARALTADNVVVACGGKSIPKMGASSLGYQLAEQFGLALTETRPALVPLTFTDALLEDCRALAGVAADAVVKHGKTAFEEAILFTHRGLSGPAILQISSYWRESTPILLDLAPGWPAAERLKQARTEAGKRQLSTVLADVLPARLAQAVLGPHLREARLGDQSDKVLNRLADRINRWEVLPTGSEGYRTAEVTLGGVDTAGLDSRTMEARAVPGLYFIGEVVDVTGWLGGYNFQWAWSSGWACGTAIAEKTAG
jgi:predicted Rossmann fold flavoprotein